MSVEPLPPEPRRGLATFRALRHRNYALYFAGQLVSLTGTWLQTAALIGLVYAWTGLSSWPAWIVAAQIGPTLLLGALGGSLADRFPKRELLLVTQTILALLAAAVAVVVWADVRSPLLLLALCLVNGVVVAVDFPARLAFVVQLVGRDDVVNAVALNALMFNVSRMAGPALAGWLLVQGVGPGPCLALNAVSYLAVLAALLAMRPAELHREPRVTTRPRLRDGLAYLAGRPRVVLLLVMTGLLSAFGWPVQALLPALVERHLDGGPDVYALLLSAIGAGALVAALAVATFGAPARRLNFLIAGAVLAACSLLVLAQARAVVPAALAAGGVGAGMILFLATSQATVQLSAADHNRGLIMGIYGSVISGGQPLGNLVFGPLADAWHVPGVVTVLGVGILASAGVVGVLLLRWRG